MFVVVWVCWGWFSCLLDVDDFCLFVYSVCWFVVIVYLLLFKYYLCWFGVWWLLVWFVVFNCFVSLYLLFWVFRLWLVIFVFGVWLSFGKFDLRNVMFICWDCRLWGWYKAEIWWNWRCFGVFVDFANLQYFAVIFVLLFCCKLLISRCFIVFCYFWAFWRTLVILGILLNLLDFWMVYCIFDAFWVIFAYFAIILGILIYSATRFCGLVDFIIVLIILLNLVLF